MGPPGASGPPGSAVSHGGWGTSAAWESAAPHPAPPHENVYSPCSRWAGVWGGQAQASLPPLTDGEMGVPDRVTRKFTSPRLEVAPQTSEGEQKL